MNPPRSTPRCSTCRHALDRARRVVHQQWSLGAVEGEGDRPAGRRALRHLDPLGAVLAGEGALRGGGRRLPGADQNLGLGLPEPSRADTRGAGEGDQRLRPRSTGKLLSSFGRAQRRRLHVERQLALLRQLHRGRQHDGPPRHRRPDRPRDAPRLGLQLASEPARALQPRLGRRRGQRLGPTRTGIRWNGREWIGDVPDYGRTTHPTRREPSS